MTDFDLPPRGPRLLDELQAIRDLLNDRDNAGVPLLRDVVKPGAMPLLDLNEIFDELTAGHDQPGQAEIQAQAAHFVAAQQGFAPEDDFLAVTAAPLPAERPPREDWQRDLLIQEVVDDFIPHIEAALRERLRNIDSATLRRWLEE